MHRRKSGGKAPSIPQGGSVLTQTLVFARYTKASINLYDGGFSFSFTSNGISIEHLLRRIPHMRDTFAARRSKESILLKQAFVCWLNPAFGGAWGGRLTNTSLPSILPVQFVPKSSGTGIVPALIPPVGGWYWHSAIPRLC